MSYSTSRASVHQPSVPTTVDAAGSPAGTVMPGPTPMSGSTRLAVMAESGIAPARGFPPQVPDAHACPVIHRDHHRHVPALAAIAMAGDVNPGVQGVPLRHCHQPPAGLARADP